MRTPFRQILWAERLKMAKSGVWMLTLVSPVIAILPGFMAGRRGEALTWELLNSVMALMHAMLFLPVLTGIFAAMLCRYEHQDGGWKQVLSLPVTRCSLYLAKFMMIVILLGTVQLLYLAAVLTVGWFREAGPVPVIPLLQGVFGGWFACLPLAALQLAVSQYWSSFGAPLALNVSLTLPNILIANSATYGPFYPWVQPMLAMSPYGQEAFGAFQLPMIRLMLVVLVSLLLFLTAGLIFFRRKAV